MATKRSRGPVRLIVTLSDLHIGSTVALLQPGFKTLEGNEIKLNAIQEWLWECWNIAGDFIDNVADGDSFALVLNGDLIEGNHHGTKQIWSPEVGDHKLAAIDLLRPLADRASNVFVVRGTECHVNNTESSIADALGAVVHPSTGIRAADRWTIDLNGVRHVFRHHIGTSVRRGLAGTQLSANLAEEQVEAINNGEPIPRVVCVAHRHKFGVYQDDNGMLVVSPPWQALTRFGHKVVSQARTKPGVFILDSRNKQFGELPEIRRELYATPEPEAFAL